MAARHQQKDFAGWWKLKLPPPTYTHVPRFEISDPELRVFLDEHGFCVVRGVLGQYEIDGAISRVWDAIEAQGTGVDRHDSSTWSNTRWSPMTAARAAQGDKIALIGNHDGRGVQHSEAAWYVRSRPQLRELFASLYGTDDLLVSFDHLNVVRSWRLDPLFRTKMRGLHLDG